MTKIILSTCFLSVYCIFSTFFFLCFMYLIKISMMYYISLSANIYFHSFLAVISIGYHQLSTTTGHDDNEPFGRDASTRRKIGHCNGSLRNPNTTTRSIPIYDYFI